MRIKSILLVLLAGIITATAAVGSFAAIPDGDGWRAEEYLKQQEKEQLAQASKSRQEALKRGEVSYDDIYYRVYDRQTRKDVSPYELVTPKGNRELLSLQQSFKQNFSNNTAVVEVPDVTAKSRFSVQIKGWNMNSKDLFFYSYNEKTKTYSQITNPDYYVNGDYVHFSTNKGGYIVISNGALKKA